MMGRVALAFVVVAGCAVEQGAPSGPLEGSNAPGTGPVDGLFRTTPAAMLLCPNVTDSASCPVTAIPLSPVTVMSWIASVSAGQLTLDRIALTTGPEGACITGLTIYTQVAGQATAIGAYPGTLCDNELASPLVVDLPAGTDYTISVGGQFVTP